MEGWQLIILSLVLVAFGYGVFIYMKKEKPEFLRPNFKYNSQIKTLAHNHDYLFLKDIYIQIDKHSYLKYDGILIANKFIYLISYKHWNGELQGLIVDNKWIIRNVENINVDNPIFGARIRLEALTKLLQIERDDCINIICLGNKVKYLEPITTNNSKELIVKHNEIVSTILNIEKHTELNDITDSEMERIANLINDENLTCHQNEKNLK